MPRDYRESVSRRINFDADVAYVVFCLGGGYIFNFLYRRQLDAVQRVNADNFDRPIKIVDGSLNDESDWEYWKLSLYSADGLLLSTVMLQPPRNRQAKIRTV